jgi:hypothetical protein
VDHDANLAAVLRQARLSFGIGEGAGQGGQRSGAFLETIRQGI